MAGIDYSKMSDADLEMLAAGKAPPSMMPKEQKQKYDFSKMTDSELEQLASGKMPDTSTASDFFHGVQQGVLAGTRPLVAGIAGGLGYLSEGQPFMEGFRGAKEAAKQEEQVIAQRSPTASLLGNLGGAVLTAPLLATKALQAGQLAEGAGLAQRLVHGAGQAARAGAGYGGLQALGHAESGGEAARMVGEGALLGGALKIGSSAAGEALGAVGQGAKYIAKKVATTLTGVPEKEIETFAARAKEVTKLYDRAGGDISQAADTLRENTMSDIQKARTTLGKQISSALENPKYQGVEVDASKVIEKLEDAISGVSKTATEFRPGEIKDLQSVLDSTKKFINEKGMISVQDLNGIKEELQKVAKSSYMNGSVIFPKGELAARAAKDAAREARTLLNGAVEEIKTANNQLYKLHRIEDLMNKNLIAAGKPEAALLAAGSGRNQRAFKQLGMLDKITGGSAQQGAENLAAARTFGNPEFLPVDTTGKAVARMLVPTGIGMATGNPIAGVALSAMSSPAALKKGIQAANFMQRINAATQSGLAGKFPNAGNVGRGAIINTGLSAFDRRLNELKNKTGGQ